VLDVRVVFALWHARQVELEHELEDDVRSDSDTDRWRPSAAASDFLQLATKKLTVLWLPRLAPRQLLTILARCYGQPTVKDRPPLRHEPQPSELQARTRAQRVPATLTMRDSIPPR
jgi:hypothetical protein